MAAQAHEERLLRIAERMNVEVDDLLDEWESLTAPAGADDPTSQLTDPEMAALANAGISLVPVTGVPSAAQRSARRLAAMRSSGLSTRDAGSLLGVTEGRIRQRVSTGELFAVRGRGRELRLPAWQFLHRASLPHLAEVLRSLPRDWPATAVELFLTSPQAQLRVGDSEVSPVDWLGSGRDQQAVISMAKAIDIGL
jgi:hypothetical protein